MFEVSAVDEPIEHHHRDAHSYQSWDEHFLLPEMCYRSWLQKLIIKKERASKGVWAHLLDDSLPLCPHKLQHLLCSSKLKGYKSDLHDLCYLKDDLLLNWIALRCTS